MKKNIWRTDIEGVRNMYCLVTAKTSTGVRHVTTGWVDDGRMMAGSIAWMLMPQHFLKNQAGWLSEHLGDALPETEDHYLVCFDSQIYPKILWFNAKKQTFGGQTALAWMPLPKPYAGPEVRR